MDSKQRISDTKSLLALNRREDSYSDRVLAMKTKPKTIAPADDINDPRPRTIPTRRSQANRIVENSIDSVDSVDETASENRNKTAYRKYSFRKSIASRRVNNSYDHRLTLFNNLFGLKGSWFGKKKHESDSSLGDEVNGSVDVTGTTRQVRQLHSIAEDSKSVGLWKKLYLATHKMVQKPEEGKRSFPIEQRAVQFVTKSMYQGYWNPICDNMHEEGLYMMPHGVIYEGELKDGMFHGHGVLHYPNGSRVEGTWVRGEIIERKFIFGDGNAFEDGNFNYCKKPDRRYATELEKGLKPAGRSQITNQDPPRLIPDGCYDAGSGFYNPLTKCIMNPKTGDIMRIPIGNEEEWIIEHCRKAWDENVGFRPDLYEDWFHVERESSDADMIMKNLMRLSLEGSSTLAFSPSQIQMMENAINIKTGSTEPKGDSSSGLGTLSWIKPASSNSMKLGEEPRLEWIHKVNVDYAVTRESRVSEIIPEN